MYVRVCGRVRERVCGRVRERVCWRECVWDSESVGESMSVWERENECVGERMSVWERE